jgi:glutathione peroxidase
MDMENRNGNPGDPMQAQTQPQTATAGIYGIPVRRADRSETTLADYAGQVMLVVNVASRCGLTPQYDGLEAIHDKYRARGFTVLGFPANEFGAQEPGSDEEIQQFCQLNYGVDFPVFSKIVVKGEGRHPLYAHLTSAQPKAQERSGILNGKLAAAGRLGNPGDITWNFEKFLVDRKGNVVARFAPDVVPVDEMVVKAIEAELAKE